MKSKGFNAILSLLVLAFIVGAAGFYLLSQQESGTYIGTNITIVTEPVDPTKAGFAPYPDLPLDTISSEPMNIKFIVEHRSALNGETVTVRGFIVDVMTQEEACPSGPPYVGFCGQPGIFLADTMDENRDKYLDIRVLLNEDDETYSEDDIGEFVEVKVVVAGSKTSLDLMKVY